MARYTVLFEQSKHSRAFRQLQATLPRSMSQMPSRYVVQERSQDPMLSIADCRIARQTGNRLHNQFFQSGRLLACGAPRDGPGAAGAPAAAALSASCCSSRSKCAWLGACIIWPHEIQYNHHRCDTVLIRRLSTSVHNAQMRIVY